MIDTFAKFAVIDPSSTALSRFEIILIFVELVTFASLSHFIIPSAV